MKKRKCRKNEKVKYTIGIYGSNSYRAIICRKLVTCNSAVEFSKQSHLLVSQTKLLTCVILLWSLVNYHIYLYRSHTVSLDINTIVEIMVSIIFDIVSLTFFPSNQHMRLDYLWDSK